MNKHRQRIEAASYNLERCKEYFTNVAHEVIYKKTVYARNTASNGTKQLMAMGITGRTNNDLLKHSTLDGYVITLDCLPDYKEMRRRMDPHIRALEKILQESKQEYIDHYMAMKDYHQGECYRERREAYDDYLASEEWEDKRRECLDHHGRECADCGATGSLDVHHLHYETLGDEDAAADLMPLCRACHMERHK